MLSANEVMIVREIIGAFNWDFKKGDNIEYNLEILSTLYKARRFAKKSKHYFNKPILIIIASIIECILDDFVIRIRKRVFDPLPNLTESQIRNFKFTGTGQTTRIKKMEKFDHYIKISERHDIFDQGVRFYQALNLLKDIRNRVHIQNRNNILDKNEFSVFTDTNLFKAQKVFEIVITKMFSKFPRKDPAEIVHNIEDFPFPWR